MAETVQQSEIKNLAIDSILLAEFDIELGSSLTYQYPPNFIKLTIFKPVMAENSFAELMLPDGAHLRDEDWTFSILKQSETDKSGLRVRFIINSEEDREGVLSPDGENLRIVFEENSVNVELNIENAEELNETDDFYEIKAGNDKISILKPSSDDEIDRLNNILRRTDDDHWTKVNQNNLIYVINLVRTKHIPGVKRGARVKAMAILSRYPHCHIFKPLLILALEKFFIEPSQNILEKLFKSISNVDITSIPSLTLSDKMILRGGHHGLLFPTEKDVQPGQNLSRVLKSVNTSVNGKTRTIETKLSYDGIQYYWETKVEFDDIPVPVKIPLDGYPQEVSDFSLSHLIQTFHSTSLKPNEPSGIMVLLHSIISQKRILFLGYQLPANDVAKCVQAACSLCSPVLKGFVERSFPYACLLNLEQLFACPGYIAGVTNPTFQSHDQWWDVLCDLNTGKVTLSPKLNSITPYGWTSAGSSATSVEEDKDREKDLVARDLEFMNHIMQMIQSRQHDIKIRAQFAKYVARFTQIAASYEAESFKKTPNKSLMMKLQMRSRAPSVANTTIPARLQSRSGSVSTIETSIFASHAIGPRAVFQDESTKRKELSMYSKRIDSWKNTLSYKIHQQEWHKKMKHRVKKGGAYDRKISIADEVYSISESVDPAIIIEKFRKFKNMDTEDVTRVYEICINLASKEETLRELLEQMPINDGGLSVIASGLFHRSPVVRSLCLSFLLNVKDNKLGSQFVARLNPFMEYALKRLSGTNVRHVNEIRKSKEHLLGSTESLDIHASRDSYLSHVDSSSRDSVIPPANTNDPLQLIAALSLENPAESARRIYSSLYGRHEAIEPVPAEAPAPKAAPVSTANLTQTKKPAPISDVPDADSYADLSKSDPSLGGGSNTPTKVKSIEALANSSDSPKLKKKGGSLIDFTFMTSKNLATFITGDGSASKSKNVYARPDSASNVASQTFHKPAGSRSKLSESVYARPASMSNINSSLDDSKKRLAK